MASTSFTSTAVPTAVPTNTKESITMATTTARRTRKTSTAAAKPAAKKAATPKKATTKKAAPAPAAKVRPIDSLPAVKVQQTVNATFEIKKLPEGTGGVRLERNVKGSERPEVTYMSQDEYNRLGRPAEGTKIERRFLLA
jgi:hypothetical protein